MITQHDEYYIGFKEGNEKALNYVYVRYYRPLFNHGRQILNDEFALSCIVHEAFLKGWEFRERMENMRHIYCFIRQDMRWKCLAYLNNPANKFRRGLVHSDLIKNYACRDYDEVDDPNLHIFDEERARLINEALPYLPPNRQTIMRLYFQHGLSYKTIARRFSTSGEAINAEVQKSLQALKKIILAQKNLEAPVPTAITKAMPAGTEIMEAEMQYIFKQRYELKQSFAAIAAKMNVTQGYVQQQYVIAHRRLRELIPSK